ncbi:MAG: hypothetical protein EWV55_10660 [Microcystis viridis Mv_BB_P_19951000_S69]|uniref:Uncharacterized protein n=1 Tax=Microcystis viridis Mv_BB_P_19951000_S68D TaxID=2486270 RepID=A0A552I3P8_MICVR|nr:MAG: hypothetical protein EWV47_14710 [Microcystis viridis Mv_BB_P_19951000_S68]TRU74613.1 MAG: hypothetical protein EWV55_10660 [Microcystis viridis Mv_BB_P_19951000_S69]TRU78099.1 MAG: hypothetical protein EWV77_04710 [Microcystis viridis Mv_BB_P_19951000_S68D]TRU90805.1 MAG: hypothetical protein EWV46_00765 [Microcystis viridis Mv_BB_P_19951000_S69D]
MSRKSRLPLVERQEYFFAGLTWFSLVYFAYIRTWFDKYKDYHENGNNESLDWLREHLIVALEFKKENNKNVIDNVTRVTCTIC